MLDLVCINQYQTVAANVEFLEASDCTMAEEYKLMKNVQSKDYTAQFKLTLRNDNRTLI